MRTKKAAGLRALAVSVVFILLYTLYTGVAFPADLIITTNTTLPAGEYTYDTVTVTNGAVLTLASDPSDEGFKGVAINAAHVTIDPGASISLVGTGYGAGLGPGKGADGAYGAAGGGYGGRGGNHYGGAGGGAVYGSATEPTDLGSGGGTNGWNSSPGGAGGGSLRLSVSGTLTNNGAVMADGKDSPNNGCSGGGGSGGSIHVTAGVLAGNGSFTANGGTGLGSACAYGGSSGGGGGGRLAIHYQTSTFTGTAEAKGGAGGFQNGADGTAAFFDTAKNDLYVYGAFWRFQQNDGPAFTYHDVSLLNSGVLFEAGTSLAANQVTLRSSAIRGVALGTITLSTAALTMDSNSSIVADSLGHGSASGPGAGGGGILSGGGGGYGGKGGNASNGSGGGQTYGSATAPTDFGSGGGSDGFYYTPGAPGGGAIRIIVTGALANDGLMAANGGNVSGYGGAGSGGSIYVTAGTLSGSGWFTANGGNANPSGGGGGGRIAIYAQTSSFLGRVEARGGAGRNYGENGSVISPQRSDATTSGAMTGTHTNQSSMTETLQVQTAVLENLTVSGDLTGTLSFTGVESVQILTGSFAGKGFTKGAWTATLGGVSYLGDWKGMFYQKPSERKIYLKGTTSGDVSGIIDGYLTESTPDSGIYDKYQASWKVNAIGSTIVTDMLDLSGTLIYQDSVPYPGTELYVLQSSVDGEVSGHYQGPLGAVLTHVRVNSQGNPYHGEGFSVMSYISQAGSGEGWTYDQVVSPGKTALKGVFTSPFQGIASGLLDETAAPLALAISVARIDLGLPALADVEVTTWGPTRVSPGQTIDYLIEYRNEGVAVAENVVIVDELPTPVDYLSSSPGGIYRVDKHEVFWRVGTLLPGQRGALSVRVQVRGGLPTNSVLTNLAAYSTTSPEIEFYLQPDRTIVDITDYLAYQVVEMTSSRTLGYGEFSAELSADPGLKDLYQYAVGQGYTFRFAMRMTFTSGSTVLEAFLSNASGQAILLTKSAGGSVLESYTDTAMSTFDAGGGMTWDIAADTLGSWGTWAVRGSPNIAECVRNCMVEELTMNAVGDKVNAMGNILGANDCKNCINTGSWTDCLKCADYAAKKLGKEAPYAGIVLTLAGCVKDCKKDTSSHFCTKDKAECQRGLHLGALALQDQALNRTCDKKPPLGNGTGLWGPTTSTGCVTLFDFDHGTRQQVCEMVGEKKDEAKCVDPADPATKCPSKKGNSFCSFHVNEVVVAKDPNVKYGPEGVVSAGQKLDYKVEFENVGEGIAFGVYFTDTLDQNLDEATLLIGPVKDKTDVEIAPAGAYDPATRTITWFVGEAGPHAGGYAEFSVNVRSGAGKGTQILNYGTVYFPSVPEVTRTNGILSYIPWTLTASAGPGGSIDPSGTVSAAPGSTQVFTVSPHSGYQVTDVKVDGVHVGGVSSYTLQNIAADHTVEAAFGPVSSNQPPVAVIGTPDHTKAMVANPVTLDGRQSYDPDPGTSLQYSWQFVERPPSSAATIAQPSAALITFVPDVAGDYVVQLVVGDGQLWSYPDTIVVTAGVLTGLPVTGQKRCWNASGAEVPCASTGQDGDVQAGVAWPSPRFTKVYCDAAGPCVDQSADCDGAASTDILRDNLTGLLWARDGNLTAGRRTWSEALAYANDSTLCGYTGWRAPNVNEMESLVHADKANIASWLNDSGFTNIQGGTMNYWTSTTNPAQTSEAFVVSFLDGYIGKNVKETSQNYLLPVRDGLSPGLVSLSRTGQTSTYYPGDDGDLMKGLPWPNPRFTEDGDCVADNLTGLLWTRSANVAQGTWQSALSTASAQSLCGRTDWRLPNRIELFSLFDFSRNGPLLPAGHPFTDVRTEDYWSATTNASVPANARVASISGGGMYSDVKGGAGVLWPVTGGCTGRFADLAPGHWAEGYIRNMYCKGITTGCTQTPPNYCPGNNVTRQAMAAFIIRALEGEPPLNYCDGGSPFTDVPPDNQFCRYIKRMKELNITLGCNPPANDNYCPTGTVKRQAMAAFIIRAVYGESFSFTSTPHFIDVPEGHQFFKYVQKMKDEGITTGCSTTQYCPTNTVNRASMGAFLGRAFLGMP